jgi:hypothetical protein
MYISEHNKRLLRQSVKPNTSDGFFWYIAGFMDRGKLTHGEFEALRRYRNINTRIIRRSEQ